MPGFCASAASGRASRSSRPAWTSRHSGAATARAGRRRAGIAADRFVVGHVGRLAPEKNLEFLASALARFAARDDRAHVLIAGAGPSRDAIARAFEAEGAGDRLTLVGVLDRPALADAYRALDVFAFASLTETQGLVVAEAMAAGVPVVALDAAGVREVVRDGVNGRLLARADTEEYVAALAWVRDLGRGARDRLLARVARTAERFSIDTTAGRTLALYADAISAGRTERHPGDDLWHTAQRRLGEEWKIVRNIAAAVGDAWLSLGREREQR
ncbi:MAG: glycosyltransferase [Burkholderiales bacterium]|nr:glycosyltransferase [Burkholderiales bacterium]